MKKIFQQFLVSVSLLLGWSASAQTPALRGIYINDFDVIFRNSVKEDSLLTYLRDSSYNYMALYDLQSIDFNNSTQVSALASFIRRAHDQYGVQYVGAVGESLSLFANKIVPYNNNHPSASEKFNVFNVEFEFWTTSSVSPGGNYCVQYLQQANCSCDTAGAFLYYKSLIRGVDSLANLQGAISETYVGWFNQGQGQYIANTMDRILLHAYRIDETSVYGYSKTRLGYLGSTSRVVQVAPIFSSEPIFMGPWLSNHAQIQAYNRYLADFNADNSAWKSKISLQGYQWFTYTMMPRNTTPSTGGSVYVPAVTAGSATSFCTGGSVTLTAESGDSYSWSNGANSNSITVTASGTYSCQVTSSGNTGTSVPITVTVYSLPTASISAGTVTNAGVTLSTTATAGSGTVSSYQWTKNNANISGATSASLLATSDGNYQVSVTNSRGCSMVSTAYSVVIPTAFVPTITASGSASFCEGGSVTLTAQSGSTYLWSNGATTRSITVTASGTYSCTLTQSGQTGTSEPIIVTSWSNPTATVVIGSSNPGSVALTANATAGSGSISNFQWMMNSTDLTSETNASMLATLDGNYQVKVTNSNGCMVTSSAASVTIPTTTTSCTLSVPTNTSTTMINSSSAILNWSTIQSCDSLLFRIRVEGSNQTSYISIPYNGQTSFTVTDLLPATAYSWKMQTKCGTTTSNLSTRIYFNTTMQDTTGITQVDDQLNNEQILLDNIITYPNPVNDHLSIKIIGESSATAILQLADVTGRILQQSTVELTKGENNFNMELQGLATGLYFVSAIHSNEIKTTRIMHIE